ncbi:nitroreductase family deazaflavin-dependent oxidoreductase [Crossiella cryophila]|uniref:Deazaflavin-dependent oxidoreductase (Nitroreductase family) n=1 Tax=Crossiella cryophila TaxID=43355 RepID=A0A7W7CFQ4_9PSEU|nr:nitroreductase family deazaflavin-dependent oxidoreductase [Crossiella cryophila]MBB4680382.1 deazaflavin-dependent oxidoreductase (nitroreductase family) [Crossiella cryophila]
MSEFNEQVIAEFRASKGVVGGFFAGVHVLLLHHVGRRSGQARINPLLYLADGADLVLIGSAGGAEREPAWVANLEAAGQAGVEVGERTLRVRPTVLRPGSAERDRLYPRMVAYWPDILKYEQLTDRPFPLVRLTPIGE